MPMSSIVDENVESRVENLIRLAGFMERNSLLLFSAAAVTSGLRG
jgi:hypothetical protein